VRKDFVCGSGPPAERGREDRKKSMRRKKKERNADKAAICLKTEGKRRGKRPQILPGARRERGEESGAFSPEEASGLRTRPWRRKKAKRKEKNLRGRS